VIKTAEVYANCPKFIQGREPVDELVVDSVITSGAALNVEILSLLNPLRSIRRNSTWLMPGSKRKSQHLPALPKLV
jgi:hypothetical protein